MLNRRATFLIAVLTTVLTLGACGTTSSSSSTTSAYMAERTRLAATPDRFYYPPVLTDEQVAAVERGETVQVYGRDVRSYSAEEIDELFTNRTVRGYEPSHGVQIEFHSADGFTYLWYPGNRAIVNGQWRVDETGAYICYRYSRNSYNPQTGVWGGRFECSVIANGLSRRVETAEGDPLHLSEQFPYVLERHEQLTIDEYRVRIDGMR